MTELRRVTFPDGGFLEVWGRDDPYDKTWLYFLDRATGEHECLPNPDDLFGSDLVDDFKEQRAMIESDAKRFVEVPMLSHQEHHEIFADFVSTLPEAIQALNRPSIHRPDIGPGGHVWSIGGFLREAEDLPGDVDVRGLWHEYRRDGLARRAREWYGSHGFEL